MKTSFKIMYAVFLILLAIFSTNCKKADEPPDNSNNNNNNTPTAPVLTTSNPVVLTQSTVQCGGNITSDGGAAVTARGVCWSTNPLPAVGDNKTTDSTGTGVFISTLTNLTVYTTYYIRAYATNSAGTGYGNVMSCATTAPVYDFDGNTYQTVKIGTQIWMAENLKVTHYQNGNAITYCIDGGTWNTLTSGAYTNYQFDISFSNIYGRLYNYYAVTDPRNLCPIGWHIPTDADWTTLEGYLGGSSVAGGKLKESGTTHWLTPNTGADNSSGFQALPASEFCGTFGNIGERANFWTSTPYDTDEAYDRSLAYNSLASVRDHEDKTEGYSIRCIKN